MPRNDRRASLRALFCCFLITTNPLPLEGGWLHPPDYPASARIFPEANQRHLLKISVRITPLVVVAEAEHGVITATYIVITIEVAVGIPLRLAWPGVVGKVLQ